MDLTKSQSRFLAKNEPLREPRRDTRNSKSQKVDFQGPDKGPRVAFWQTYTCVWTPNKVFYATLVEQSLVCPIPMCPWGVAWQGILNIQVDDEQSWISSFWVPGLRYPS